MMMLMMMIHEAAEPFYSRGLSSTLNGLDFFLWLVHFIWAGVKAQMNSKQAKPEVPENEGPD